MLGIRQRSGRNQGDQLDHGHREDHARKPPYEEEAWEVFCLDELFSGEGFFDDVIGKELNYEMAVKSLEDARELWRKLITPK